MLKVSIANKLKKTKAVQQKNVAMLKNQKVAKVNLQASKR